jgi:hypothetical protein
MSLYTYYFLNGDGSIPAFEFDECSGDAEAAARALERLSLLPERKGVEVRRGQKVVFQTRDGAHAC